jgi:dTDP-4-dehydrorhamnose 3,5-epimerase
MVRLVGVELTAKNKQQLWLPSGFAHGYFVLSEWAEVVYKTTDYYAPEFERSILWNDPDVGIDWPVRPGQIPLVSPKDSIVKSFKDAEYFA